MPRRWLQQRLPTHQQLHEQLGMDTTAGRQPSKVMQWVKEKLADPMLWHLNRRSVAGAVALGLFIGWLPIPMQMLIAALLAATLRVDTADSHCERLASHIVWKSVLRNLVFSAWLRSDKRIMAHCHYSTLACSPTWKLSVFG